MSYITDIETEGNMTALSTADRELSIRMWFAADEKCGLDQIGSVDDLCWLDPTDVVQTHETYADFVKTHGEPQIARTFGERQAFIWRGVQVGRDKARGNLYLTEFDGVSASYYAGGR
jgi:hypothetical protein